MASDSIVKDVFSVEPILLAGLITTNAVVGQARDGAAIAQRTVAFSYGVNITSLPPDDRMAGFGPVERAEVVDTPDATWQRGDVLSVLAFAGHRDAAGNWILPEVVDYTVAAVRRLPGPVPLIVLSLTGTVQTA